MKLNPAPAVSPAVLLYAAFTCACMLSPAQAQTNYPSRPIRMIVPFAPGGGTDIMARAIAVRYTETWGQPVVVDNRAGGGGNIGTDIVAKAPADGYTLLFNTNATIVINPHLSQLGKISFDPLRDFAPITQAAVLPFTLLLHPSVPAKSVAELVTLIRAKPGEFNYGSSGNGGGAHLAGESLRTMAKLDMTHIPYKGIPPAVTDVIAGRVSMLMTTTISAGPHVKSGKLRALAVTSPKRLAAMPEVPAIAETVPGYEADAFQAMVAPAGVPREIIRQLAADIADILRLPDVRERITADGAEPVGSTPEAFAAFLKKETAKWGKVVKDSGAKAD